MIKSFENFLNEQLFFDKELYSDKLRNVDKYRTGNFYITPDGSKIESIDESGEVITGIIIDSPIKVQIGYMNVFLRSELSNWSEHSNKNLDIDPFGEEYW